TAWIASPTGPLSDHHSRTATTTASASSRKPTPSRRCSGSSSRAPAPILRTAPPVTFAMPIQVPRAARQGRPTTPPRRAAVPPRRREVDPDPRRAWGRVEAPRLRLVLRERDDADAVLATVERYATSPPVTGVTRDIGTPDP